MRTLIENVTVLSIAADGSPVVLRDHIVELADGRITAVRSAAVSSVSSIGQTDTPTRSSTSHRSDPSARSPGGGHGQDADATRIDGRGRFLLPGLIQSHIHLCQGLFRNHADGLPLLPWLRDRIWPFEGAHDESSLRASANLAIAELIRGGTTCVLDMGTVHHTDVVFDAARQAGFRLTGGKAHMDLPSTDVAPTLREETATSLREGEALCKRWHGVDDNLLRYAFAPRFVLSCTDELMRDVAPLARQSGALLHTHASENPAECEVVRARCGKDNVEALHDLGLSGADTILAHAVHVTDREVDLLRETGTHVIHCPSANFKLASGIAPVPRLLNAGVNVGIGADGAPCNNTLDAFHEMRLASLIHCPRDGATAMPASTAFALATRNGARALGLEAEIGAIEVGMRADVILLDLDKPHATPHGPYPFATVVYCARPSDVTDVWIAGRHVMANGELTTLDMSRVLREANEQARLTLERVP